MVLVLMVVIQVMDQHVLELEIYKVHMELISMGMYIYVIFI